MDTNPGWSDFGGGTDPDESLLETAAREGSEELTGFLGNERDIRALLSAHGHYVLDYRSHYKGKPSVYRCHVCPMVLAEGEFELLPQLYNRNARFLHQRLPPTTIRNTKLFEKTEIRWFTFPELNAHKRSFRTFYRNIVQLLLDHQPDIETFVRTRLKKKPMGK